LSNKKISLHENIYFVKHTVHILDMRHHQLYPRKQHANKLTNNDYEGTPIGGGDEEQVMMNRIQKCLLVV
jgi:hypothetical protein